MKHILFISKPDNDHLSRDENSKSKTWQSFVFESNKLLGKYSTKTNQFLNSVIIHGENADISLRSFQSLAEKMSIPYEVYRFSLQDGDFEEYIP